MGKYERHLSASVLNDRQSLSNHKYRCTSLQGEVIIQSTFSHAILH